MGLLKDSIRIRIPMELLWPSCKIPKGSRCLGGSYGSPKGLLKDEDDYGAHVGLLKDSKRIRIPMEFLWPSCRIPNRIKMPRGLVWDF